MAPRIQRPETPAAVRGADEDSVEIPLKVMRDSLLTGYFGWVEIEALGATVGVLGAFDTIVLFGAVMTTAGAGVLFVAGAMALLHYMSRSELEETKKTIVVITSPGGLPVMAGMAAAGYSPKEAVRVGEYAAAVFSAYKLQQNAEKGYESVKEEASAANDFRELNNFIHERFTEERSDADADRESAPADSGHSIEPGGDDDVRIWFENGHWNIAGTTRAQAPDEYKEASGDGDEPGRGDIGEKPGPGEIGGHSHDGDDNDRGDMGDDDGGGDGGHEGGGGDE